MIDNRSNYEKFETKYKCSFCQVHLKQYELNNSTLVRCCDDCKKLHSEAISEMEKENEQANKEEKRIEKINLTNEINAANAYLCEMEIAFKEASHEAYFSDGNDLGMFNFRGVNKQFADIEIERLRIKQLIKKRDNL